MHIGYALVVGASLLRYGRRRAVRFLIGVLYPLFVLLVVVATGNHFLFDALTGAVVAGHAAGAALLLARPPSDARLTRFPERPAPARAPEELAA